MPIGRHGRQTDPGVANSRGFGVVAAMNNTSILSQSLNPSRAALTSTKHFALHLSVRACGRAVAVLRGYRLSLTGQVIH